VAVTILLAGTLAWAMRARRGTSAQPPRRGVSTPAPPIGDTLVAEAMAWGRLLVLRGDDVVAEYALSTPSVVVGRSQDVTVTILGDPTISRSHARLTFLGGRAQIIDKESSHGTRVNGRMVVVPTTLHSGDLITLGQTRVRFKAAP
jgi:pSer/pThr/pTyr-binding forkhead associated (FHA) protein